ncbi:MAG: hypothetical protein ACR2KU_14790 [Gammaproteobacteria bacterium]
MFSELQNSLVAEALRGSTWVYPLVNAAHILGFALLLGAIVPLDLRRLGFWRSVPAATLSRVLTPVAMAGLLIAVSAGSLLFIARAVEYAASGLFQAKMRMRRKILQAFGSTKPLPQLWTQGMCQKCGEHLEQGYLTNAGYMASPMEYRKSRLRQVIAQRQRRSRIMVFTGWLIQFAA